MKHTALTFVCAGLLGLAGPATAHAGVELTTTPFTGTTTSYLNVADNQDLGTTPYTDPNGRTVGGDGFLVNEAGFFNGLVLLYDSGNPAATLTLTWTNLAANTLRAGFTFADNGNDPEFSPQLVSATFSNGDVYNATTPFLSGFIGFISDHTFTSVVLNFRNNSSPILTDFTTSSVSAVPEPSTLASAVTGGLVAAGAAASAWRRRRARRGG